VPAWCEHPSSGPPSSPPIAQGHQRCCPSWRTSPLTDMLPYVRFKGLYDISSQLPYPNLIQQRVAMKIGDHHDIARVGGADWRNVAQVCAVEEERLMAMLEQMARALPDHVSAARKPAVAEGLSDGAVAPLARLLISHARAGSGQSQCHPTAWVLVREAAEALALAVSCPWALQAALATRAAHRSTRSEDSHQQRAPGCGRRSLRCRAQDRRARRRRRAT